MEASPSGRGAVDVLGLITERDGGVPYVRFLQPFERLRQCGFRLRLPPDRLSVVRTSSGWEPDPAWLDGVSMLVFPQMVLSPVLEDGTRIDVVGPLCRAARERGIKVVWSPDDHLEHIDSANPSYEVVSGSAHNLEALATGADALIVTTDELRRTLAAWGKPTWLLPNAIDSSRWTPRPRRSAELRVGWAGSSSHVEDLLLILPALAELQRRLPFRFFLLGLVDRPLDEVVREVKRLVRGLSPSRRLRAERFLELARRLAGIEYVHQPFVPLTAYFSRLPALDLDIGLCPLLDTPFNRHKSALKFYEYAITGSMTIASAIPPYAGEVSVTVPEDPQAWSDTLERFLRDAGKREAEAEAQRAFVLARRNIDTLHLEWASALEAILALPAPDAGRAAADRGGAILVPCSAAGSVGAGTSRAEERDE